MTKVLDIHHKGYFCVCLFDENEAVNPYKLYKVNWGTNKYGYPAKHRKLIAKYADFKSVLCHIGAEANGEYTGCEALF